MKHIPVYSYLLPVLLLAPLTAPAQNLPQNGQTAPAGSTVTYAVPAETPVFTAPNYTAAFVPLLPISDPAAVNTNSPITSVRQQLSYTDGFNRPIQSVTRTVARVNGQDQHLVQLFDQRETGYESYSYLPYSATTFGYQDGAYQQQKNYYSNLYPGEGYTPYARTANASGSSSRAVTTYAPGKSNVGQTRGSTARQILNAASEVRLWTLNAAGAPVSTGYYAAGELTGAELTGAAAAGTASNAIPLTRSFRDRDGRTVLKQTARDGGWLSTYYVYDTRGNQAWILPPKALQFWQNNGSQFTAAALQGLCFSYQYEESQNRCSGERQPGERGFTATVYDFRNRPVMRQTPKEAADGQWEVTFYDAYDRVTATGLYQDPGHLSAADWQLRADAPAAYGSTGNWLVAQWNAQTYPNRYNPFSLSENPDFTTMTVSFYDKYAADASTPGSAGYGLDPYGADCQGYLQFTELYTGTGAETPLRSNRTEGRLTCTIARILPSPNAKHDLLGDWKVTMPYYDSKGRVIYSVTYQRDVAAGRDFNFDFAGMQYDFAGRLRRVKHKTRDAHINPGQTAMPHTELTQYDYDAYSAAPLRTQHKVDGGPWTPLCKYTYDDLGRLARKELGDGIEVQDYSYNLRGQLTGINAPYAETGNKQGLSRSFGVALKYDYGFTKNRIDGKLAGITWRASDANTQLAYGYDYTQDLALASADFNYRDVSNSYWRKDYLDFSVKSMTYDANGNITHLQQMGVRNYYPDIIDDITYNYAADGNQLLSAQDNALPGSVDFRNTGAPAAAYAYDANGNQETDPNRYNCKTTYTFFNRPDKTYNDKGAIEYSYDALGNKLQELLQEPQAGRYQRTDYIGNAVYRSDQPDNSNGDADLQYLLTAEGRTVYKPGDAQPFKEEVFVKDHLGNVRSTVQLTALGTKAYLATYELASAHLENLVFDDIDPIRDDRPGATGDNKMAAVLDGSDPARRTGSSLFVRVMSGDKVNLNVNTYYDYYDPNNDQPATTNDMFNALIGALTGGVNGMAGAEHNVKYATSAFSPSGFTQISDLVSKNFTDPNRPKAYLNYALFDGQMRLVPGMTGAFQADGQGQWAQIGTANAMEVPVNGYLAVWLSNSSSMFGGSSPVYFDQLQFRVAQGALMEENHYYPTGLPIEALGGRTDDCKENRCRYQGNELTADLGLQLMDFNARQYDPQLGRFLSVDPLAALPGQESLSPYAAMGNQFDWMTDPMGLFNPPVGSTNASCMVNDNVGAVEGASSASGGNSNPTWSSMSGILDPFKLAAGAGFPALVQSAMQRNANQTFWQTFTGAAESGTVYVSDGNGGFKKGPYDPSYTAKKSIPFLNNDWTWDGVGYLVQEVTVGQPKKVFFSRLKSKIIGALEAADRANDDFGDAWGNSLENSAVGDAYHYIDHKMGKHTDPTMGNDGYNLYGKPYLMKTTAVLGTVVTCGAYAFEAYGTFAAYSAGTANAGTYVGFAWSTTSATIGTTNTVNTLINNNSNQAGFINNYIGTGADLFDAFKYRNPLAFINLGIRIYDYKTTNYGK